MNSQNSKKLDGLKSPKESWKSRVVLQIRGIGHVPSKKNHHYPGKNGRLLIDKKIKERMKLLEEAIVCELLSAWRTTVKETGTGCSLRSWMLSSVPEDDCWNSIPHIELEVRLMPEPTLEITIEELP